MSNWMVLEVITSRTEGVIVWTLMLSHYIDSKIQHLEHWSYGMTSQDRLHYSSIVLWWTINEDLEVLQHCIGLDWTDCTSWLKEAARYILTCGISMEIVTMHCIPVSRSAILLPTTCWPSEDILEIQDTMRWRWATVHNSQRRTPITMMWWHAPACTPVDSGMVIAVMLM